MKPLIHLFKTPGGKYIYDVNKNSIFRVDSKVYEILYCIHENGLSDEKIIEQDVSVHGYVKRLRDNGFLSSNRIERIIHPLDGVLEYYMNNKVQRMILQVTQQCNFRCRYCVYSGEYINRSHSNRKMSLETAKKSIDFLYMHSQESNQLSIGFYGGEPLLEFPLIKQVIEYSRERLSPKSLSFSITSNGTLLNDEIIKYLSENNVVLIISLDGPKEIHDTNRKFTGSDSSTYDRIMNNLKDIRACYPEYYKKIAFSVVIDPNNDLSCTRSFFHNNDLVKDLYMATSLVDDSYRKESIKTNHLFREQLEYEYFKLLLCKLGIISEKYVSNLISDRYYDIKRMNDELKATPVLSREWHHNGPCLPGVQRLLVDVNGDLFPCERVSESSSVMKIGSIQNGFDIEKARALLNIGKLSEDNCKKCWAVRFCSICAKLCDNGNELSAVTKEENCVNVRKNIDEKLKVYCMLKEFGHDFESDDEFEELF